MQELTQAAQGLLIVVFALASIEKASRLKNGSAPWHPVFVRSRIRADRATKLMVVSLAVDLLIVGGLWQEPRLGGALAALATITYSIVGVRAYRESGGDCGCTIILLQTKTRAGYLTRNLALATASLGLIMRVPSEVTSSFVAISVLAILLLEGLIRVADRLAQRSHTSGGGSARFATLADRP